MRALRFLSVVSVPPLVLALMASTGHGQDAVRGSGASSDETSWQVVQYDVRHYRFKGEAAPLEATADPVALAKEVEGSRDWQLLRRIQISGLAAQPAMVQMGEEVPITVGSSSFGGGRVQQNYQMRQVGTLARVTGRTTEQGVIVDLDYECSDVLPTPPSDDAATAPTTPSIQTLTVETTIMVPQDGVVAIELSGEFQSKQRNVIVLAARAGTRAEPAAAARVERRPSAPRQPAVESADPNTNEDRVLRYAGLVVQKYDQNGDNLLEAGELERSSLFSSLQRSLDDLDKDDDGKLSAEELAAGLRARSGQ